MSESFDFIIVGGGIAGLVLAARLTEDPDVQVLVIEAGEDQTADPRVNVPAMWPALLGTSADWNFTTVPQTGLQSRELRFPQGCTLGGCSALNGLAFSATSKANVDAWEDLGNPGWGWSSFSESMKKSYTLTLPSKQTEGNGPVHITVPDEHSEWTRVWMETLRAMGFPITENSFSGQVYGGLVVADSLHPETKQRSFAGNAYLAPARNRGNLTLWTQTLADKILFDKSSDTIVASGVQITKDGETKTVQARKEVILAAGAISSPKVLELSGIGDASRLQSLGIDVIIDNPNVGENMQNHPLCSLSFEVIDKEGFETMDNLARERPDAVADAMEAYSRQSGPLAKSGTNAAAQLPFPGIGTRDGDKALKKILEDLPPPPDTGPGEPSTAFARAHESFVRSNLTSPTEASGCYLSFPGFAAYEGDGSMASMAAAPPGLESWFSIALLLAHPLSRGSVHITSASSTAPNLAIDPRFLTHPLDIEVLARHLQYLEKLASTPPLADQLKLSGKRNSGAPPAGGFADLDTAKEYLRDTAVGAMHYTGTCAMMPREMGGVVDARLRVYGCRNLRVCDASIIPITPRTNIQATVYGIAEHGAGIIKVGL